MSQWENPVYVEKNFIEMHVYRAKRLPARHSLEVYVASA
jgi:hypothetical protein